MCLAEPITQPKAGDAYAELTHQAECAASVKATCAWREWGSLAWSCGCVCLKKQRRVRSDIHPPSPYHPLTLPHPPLLWLSRPPFIPASLRDNWGLGWGQQGWVVTMLIHPATLWRHGGASWEAWEGGKSVFHTQNFGSLLCYGTLFNGELAWQWTALIMAAAGGDVGERGIVGGGNGRVGAGVGGASRCYATPRASQPSSSCPTGEHLHICCWIIQFICVCCSLSLSLLSLFSPQVLRTHVMVRVGGGWDTLEHYLDKHDPCRCAAFGEVISYSLSGPCKTTSLMPHCYIIHRTFKIVNTLFLSDLLCSDEEQTLWRSRGSRDSVCYSELCNHSVCVLPL